MRVNVLCEICLIISPSYRLVCFVCEKTNQSYQSLQPTYTNISKATLHAHPHYLSITSGRSDPRRPRAPGKYKCHSSMGRSIHKRQQNTSNNQSNPDICFSCMCVCVCAVLTSSIVCVCVCVPEVALLFACLCIEFMCEPHRTACAYTPTIKTAAIWRTVRRPPAFCCRCACAAQRWPGRA